MPSFRDVSSDAFFRDVSSMPSLETSRRMPHAFCALEVILIYFLRVYLFATR